MLLPQIKGRDDLLVFFRGLTVKMFQKPFAATDHLDKPVALVVIFDIFLKMSGKTVDALCEKSDLHLVGP